MGGGFRPGWQARRFGALALAWLSLGVWPGRAAEEKPGPTVGMPATIAQLVLPGPELEARPIDDRRTRVVVRILDVYPHGDSFRYDLQYYGLEPGDYDLRDYLRRKDGRPIAADLPTIPVTVRPILPPGQILPHGLEPRRTRTGGGYRLMIAVGALAWVAGVLAILLYGRRKKTTDVAPARAVTLADRLRPLVEAAVAGRLEPGRRAELERMLIGYWSRRLGLERAEPAEVIVAIRRHEQAGILLGQLEAWLHRPEPAGDVDLAALLAPYRDLPAEELEPVGGPELSGRAG